MPCKSATLDWEIEQEKNLMYVAYTRAKNKLCFINENDFKNLTDYTNDALKNIEHQVNFILGKSNDIIKYDANYSKHIISRAKTIVRPIKGSSKVLGEKSSSVLTDNVNNLLIKNKKRIKKY